MSGHHDHHSSQKNSTNTGRDDIVDQFIGHGIDQFMAAMDGHQISPSAHDEHMHSGHQQHGEHDTGHHMMKMWFHGGYEEVILFDWWRIDSLTGLIISCLLIFGMGVAYEALKWSRVHLQAKLTKSITPINRRNFFQVLLPGLYVIQLVLAYWLMLIAMTYNTYLTAAVILGGGVGHWIFAVINPIQCDELAADSCH